MNKLTEQDLLRPFIGKSVNHENFANVAYQNGSKYMICNADYIDKQQYCELFGITERLKWIWGYSGIDFTILLTVEEGIITECHLYKCKESGGGHGRPRVSVLNVSQQELRIARRIMQYVTHI